MSQRDNDAGISVSPEDGARLTMPEILDDLPPSAKACFAIIYYEDAALTQQELADATGLTQRTVRYALEGLCETAELVESSTKLSDARKDLYTLAESASVDDTHPVYNQSDSE